MRRFYRRLLLLLTVESFPGWASQGEHGSTQWTTLPAAVPKGGPVMPDPSVLGIVLAGGAGTRLSPLTADRAKPAVPFGGLYRLIDFALSNLANGGIRKICVLTQYKSHSLGRNNTTTGRVGGV